MFSRSDGAVVIGVASLAALILGVSLWLSPTSWQFPEQNNPSPIDLNHASMADLMELSGIGPVLAERIVQYRRLNGPFQSLEQLLDVQGIGSQTLERLRPRLRICALPSCDF